MAESKPKKAKTPEEKLLVKIFAELKKIHKLVEDIRCGKA